MIYFKYIQIPLREQIGQQLGEDVYWSIKGNLSETLFWRMNRLNTSILDELKDN